MCTHNTQEPGISVRVYRVKIATTATATASALVKQFHLVYEYS